MLSAYMDGELNLVDRLEIERHVHACSECAFNLANGRAVQSAVQTKHLYHAAPRGLESRVLVAVRAAERLQRRPLRPMMRPLLGTAAFASVAALLWLAAQVPRANREAAVSQQVTAGHVQSLMAKHLLDVASPERRVVKRWFHGRLDYNLPTIDLDAQRYPLSGGRLDYLNDRTVAALVYTRQKHVVNLFIWPSGDAVTQPLRQESRQGFSLCRWTWNSLTFCAVSDLSPAEMTQFVAAVQEHTQLSIVPENRR
jgi:anti-sigma factor RsiW